MSDENNLRRLLRHWTVPLLFLTIVDDYYMKGAYSVIPHAYQLPETSYSLRSYNGTRLSTNARYTLVASPS